MIKRTLITVPIIVLIKCKTVSRKPCINREDKSERSQFIFTDILVTRTTYFVVVVAPPSICHIKL